uniref:Nucleoporin_N domain-containing protein n=1 Tax=Caenorhabditis tropicalis TaxID=1561998 RepID=A0A1I7U3E5_9PELO
MATQSAVTATAVPQGPQSSAATASIVPSQGGLWNTACQFFSSTAPKIGKDGEFSFQFLTSPQRSKPAATVNADNFYMYACGSINMP